MMTGPGDDSAVAQRVLFAVEGQQSLSVLASVLAEAQDSLGDPDQLGGVIALSPGLTLALLQATQTSWQKGGTFSVERLVRAMQPRAIRSMLLGADLYGEHESEQNPDPYSMVVSRQALVMHSVAVAICAQKIAQMEQGREAGDQAYIAGLLHDCGKLALEQAMPKGYAQVRERAAVDDCGSLHAERSLLFTDHTVLGKRLATHWGLPEAVVNAAWLHHTKSVGQLSRLGGYDIAHWVRLANMLVNAGRDVEVNEQFSHMMDWPQDRITLVKDHLEQRLPAVQAVVRQDNAESMKRLARQTRQLARTVSLSEQQLHDESTQLQAEHVNLKAAQDLLMQGRDSWGVVSTARSLAQCWQRQFQTGAVGVIALERHPQAMGSLVLCGDFGQHIETLMEIPEEARLLWKDSGGRTLLRDAEDHFDWLFCQLEFSLDLTRTQWLPLSVDDDLLGVLFFEQNYPADTQRFEDRYRELARSGAVLLKWSTASRHEQRLSEGLVEELSRPMAAAMAVSAPADLPMRPQEPFCEALGEVAAGLAHELNNPLSVIVGRSELLSQQDLEGDFQASLQLIRDNAVDISSLVESLMGFAEPPSPRPQGVQVQELMEEAIQLAQNKLERDDLDIQVDFDGGLESVDVWVDSAQMASALSNLLVNATEAYPAGFGPVVVRVAQDNPRLASIRIEDQGVGMSDEVRKKAFYPFYSDKAAGRKRGMGLPFAARLIHLNGGTLSLGSGPSGGTTATLLLPISS